MALFVNKLIIINQEGQTTPPSVVHNETKEESKAEVYKEIKDGVLVKKYNKRSTYLADMLPIDFEI